ncbi:MAG: hypothetical protein PWQ59_906 [Thermoanaerobacterium sp.]|nr:hypothetical protein [Thermoanaerobacterium sp.]
MAVKYIDSFIYAIEEEIKAMKRENEASVIKIYDGKYIRNDESNNIYKFSFENEFYDIEEIKAKITVNGEVYSAEILSVIDSKVEISIPEFLGHNIKEAILDFRLWYLLEILKKRYQNCDESTINCDFILSNMIFDGNIPQKIYTDEVKFSKSGLNDAQIKAVKKSLSEQFNIIWGPPGTGKTKTLAKIIEEHLKLGRRVLLISHSNNAVDEAMKNVMKNLKKLKIYNQGKILRYGYPQNGFYDYYSENYQNILIENILKSKCGLLLSSKELYKNNISTLIIEKEKINKIILDYEKISMELEDDSNKIELSLSVLKTHLNECKNRNSDEDIEKLIDTIEKKELENIELNKRIKESKSKLKQIKLLKDRLKEIDRQIYDINEKISKIDNEIIEKRKEIIAEAKLIATTVTKTFCDDKLAKEKFDVLIIDEVSMVQLPHLYWVFSRCKLYGFITLAGDFLQLPPICITDNQFAKEIIGKNIFNIIGIDEVNKAIINPYVCLLDTQYRMVPELSAISNKFYYNGRLKDDISVILRTRDYSMPTISIIDTSNTNPRCYKMAKKSRFNIYNAFICIEIAKRILEKNKKFQIGIITPYAAQARLINKIIRDKKISGKLMASTVHRFQGGECDVIIYDLSDSEGVDLSPLINDFNHSTNADLLLNVALTRAKMNFCFVGNIAYLKSRLILNSKVEKVISYLLDKANLIQSEEILDLHKVRLIANNDSKLVENIKDDFLAAFINDFIKVKKRFIVICPEVLDELINGFIPRFTDMIQNGIEITLYTSPTYKKNSINDRKTIDKIKEIGVMVIEREKIEINLYIIDSIIWEGDVNIFSGKYVKGKMMRYEGQFVTEEIIKNLELNKSNGIGDVVDKKCPKCGRPMIIRKGKYSTFLGCSGYPYCNGTVGLK